MIRMILVIGLTWFISNYAWSQNNTFGESWIKTQSDSLLKQFNSSDDYDLFSLLHSLNKQNETHQEYSYSLPVLAERRVPDDKMPIINPRGNYSAVIIKPDSAKHYYLLIRKP